MTVKKIQFLAIALLAAAVCACQKEPSTSGLHKDYLVYTDHDTSVDFSTFDTYFVPDSILLIGDDTKAEYWKGADAQQIVAEIAARMDAAGYVRTTEKEEADLGLQLSYVRRVTYFVGYDNPYWWWYYPYYWAPGYWGDWAGWYYPYRVYYGYTAGSMLLEMVNLDAPGSDGGKKLPVVWDSFIGGLLTDSQEVNLRRTLDAVGQAFVQSPYLKK